MLAAVARVSQEAYDYNYVYALLMDQEYGVMNNLLSDVMTCSPHLFKAKKNDPDLLPLQAAPAGPHYEEFTQAMRCKIEELEAHGTWKVV